MEYYFLFIIAQSIQVVLFQHVINTKIYQDVLHSFFFFVLSFQIPVCTLHLFDTSA